LINKSIKIHYCHIACWKKRTLFSFYCHVLCYQKQSFQNLFTLIIIYLFFWSVSQNMTIPVATRSKAWVCGCSLAGMWVRILPGAWMSVSCECCVLSGRGLCDGLITCPEESYRVWCDCVRSRNRKK
jgi:hypothetical protein